MTTAQLFTRDDVISSLRCAGQVERFHTWPIPRRPTVAESTWHVMRIYLQVFGSPPKEVWEYVLLHDADEVATGDVPFYAKRMYPGVKLALDDAEGQHRDRVGRVLPTITDIEWRRFKACDLLEMHEFARHELLMTGNVFAQVVVDQVEGALYAMGSTLGPDDFTRVQVHMQRRLA